MKLEAARLYIRAPNWVGDLVMATPILRAIREAYPASHITVGVRPGHDAVLRGDRSFDSLHFHPRKLGFGGLRRLAAELARERFDAAFLLPNSFETALAAALAKIPRRFGYAASGRSLLLTDRLAPAMAGFRRIPTPMPNYWAELLRLAGIEARDLRPRLFVDDETAASVDRWLSERGIAPGDRFAVVAPGASFGASKLWRADRFAEVIDDLARREGLKSLVQFGPGEEAIANDIVRRSQTGALLADAPPLDLHRLKAAIRRCALLVCTDSGVRHYGVAFEKPVVCVMGPNDPRYTAANLERTIVVREDVECGPCQLKVCPLDHRCMERIPAERVVGAALELLRSPRAGPTATSESAA